MQSKYIVIAVYSYEVHKVNSNIKVKGYYSTGICLKNLQMAKINGIKLNWTLCVRTIKSDICDTIILTFTLM